MGVYCDKCNIAIDVVDGDDDVYCPICNDLLVFKENRSKFIDNVMKVDDVVKVDLVLDRVKALEMRVKQLEKTIERMDMTLCAMNHRQVSEMERGFSGPRFG